MCLIALIIGVPRETFGGERRVALTPRACDALIKLKLEVIVESSAGLTAGFPDDDYARRGVRMASRGQVFAEAGIVVQARAPGANPDGGLADLQALRSGQGLVGFGAPPTALRECFQLAERGVSFFAIELVPRITRAQAMDALSSMASIAGYEAVLIGAVALPKLFPMMMTAAGTLTAAKGRVLGAGGAGVQAI